MPDPYTIAAWRYEHIAPLLDPELDEAGRRAAVRERTRARVEWPGASRRKKSISKSTLYRWLAAYRKHGYAGLMPKPRSDYQRPRNADTETWVHYAIALLYEQPTRSLIQLQHYLALEFQHYSLSRSTLSRHLRAHSAYGGLVRWREGAGRRLRGRYEADYPHQSWQLDGKGPFPVEFVRLGRLPVHVLSILDDCSRVVLAARVAPGETAAAAVDVFEHAGATWGLAERFQFDGGSGFESEVFRTGLVHLGIHRNAMKPRTPEWQGKIEAYHRCLKRWFVEELATQIVHDFEHLQQLLDAVIAVLYNRHYHRELAMSPEQRLAGRLSPRRVPLEVLQRAFFIEHTATAERKTGKLVLPNGHFRVGAEQAGRRLRFAYHPVHRLAVVLLGRGRELSLAPFLTQPLPAPLDTPERRGEGQLQKLHDHWRGRPNAEPGFGLPEVFSGLAPLLGYTPPQSAREATAVAEFYRALAPLERERFTAACARTRANLGPDRPLAAYLSDLTRQLRRANPQGDDV